MIMFAVCVCVFLFPEPNEPQSLYKNWNYAYSQCETNLFLQPLFTPPLETQILAPQVQMLVLR